MEVYPRENGTEVEVVWNDNGATNISVITKCQYGELLKLLEEQPNVLPDHLLGNVLGK